MNRRNLKTRSKSSLFLMELIIVLMFFSLCAAICMKVFATSKVKTDYARDLSQASFAAETVAEVYKEKNGEIDDVSKYFSTGTSENGTYKLFYDKQWNNVAEPEDGGYELSLVSNEDGRLREAVIKVSYIDKEDDIFEIAVATVNTANSEEGV